MTALQERLALEIEELSKGEEIAMVVQRVQQFSTDLEVGDSAQTLKREAGNQQTMSQRLAGSLAHMIPFVLSQKDAGISCFTRDPRKLSKVEEIALVVQRVQQFSTDLEVQGYFAHKKLTPH